MNTVFIGGSRHVSRLPAQVKERLNNIIENRHRVIVGDANGADKAVQKYFLEASYDEVIVFCSGEQPRNNLGQWKIHSVTPSKRVKGFQFYAAKDREMAREADFGFMIWDGKSPGTVLNVLRLVRAGKKAVLLNVPDKLPITIKTSEQWNDFLAGCSPEFRADLRDRATPNEWDAEPNSQPSLLDELEVGSADSLTPTSESPSDDELAEVFNAALASGDASSVVDALGNIARARGMTHIAKETGLARESLYRSLGPGGNPEFGTVLKVVASLGFRLEANRVLAGPRKG